MKDKYNLDRFVEAQVEVYEKVISELKNGFKVTHCMWFIFPQIEGLGFSTTSIFYSIHSKNEAIEYLNHPLLGRRLIECTSIVNNIQQRSALEIFGQTDELKFRSSMTLFDSVQQNVDVFKTALLKYFGGMPDKRTCGILLEKK